MNKQGFIDLVEGNLPNGGNIPSSDHRDTMRGNANSVSELVYGDVVIETSGSPSILSPVTDISYTIKIQKIGRRVFMDGSITNSRTSGVTTLFNISGADYLPTEDNSYFGSGRVNTDSSFMGIRVRNYDLGGSDINTVQSLGSLLPNETVEFTLSYNSNI